MSEEKKDKKNNGEDFTKVVKKLSQNYWAVATIVLAILLVMVLFNGTITGNAVSTTVAGEKVLAFAQQQGVQGTLLSVEENGNLYMVKLDIEGQEVPVYITKDGENFIPNFSTHSRKPIRIVC